MIITLTGSTIQTIVEHSLGLYTDPNFTQCYWTNESVFNHQCILTPTEIVDLLSDFSGFEVEPELLPPNEVWELGYSDNTWRIVTDY